MIQSVKTVAEQLEEEGYLLLPSSQHLLQCTQNAYDAWNTLFNSRKKFALPGNISIPSGYLPLSFAGGCEMKESFYYHTGMKLPVMVQETTRLIADLLLAVAEDIAVQIESYIGHPIIYEKGRGCLRIMRYPAFTGESESTLMEFMAQEGQLRSPEHTDLNALTILPFSTSPGLEIMNNSGQWDLVDDIQKYTIIHSGQQLESRTGGRFRPTLHRVRNPLPAEWHTPRFSMAFFVS